MNLAAKKRNRQQLRPVAEDTGAEEEELMTKEELELMKETTNIERYAFNRKKGGIQKTDSIVSKSKNNRNINSTNSSSKRSQSAEIATLGSNRSRQLGAQNRKTTASNRYEFDDDLNDDEGESAFKRMNDAEVKEMFDDVLKKRTQIHRQNQDQFCSILAQMILKNKINKENAFEIPLPDVKDMSDFAKVSEASWQKLSSSLDSGAKIYGYRVDSLHQESFKMLGGLIRSEYQYGANANEEGGEKGEDEDNEDVIKREREKLLKKAKKISDETIEKNISNITLVRYDIQFEVDPLFCKTSARFDDASSKGILLNNIQIDNKLKLMMDSENQVESEEITENSSQRFNERDPRSKSLIQRDNFKLRSDWSELELCQGMENFVSSMMNLDFDDVRLLDLSPKNEDIDNADDMNIGSQHQSMYPNEKMEYDYGSGEQGGFMDDIERILSQTARKKQKKHAAFMGLSANSNSSSSSSSNYNANQFSAYQQSTLYSPNNNYKSSQYLNSQSQSQSQKRERNIGNVEFSAASDQVFEYDVYENNESGLTTTSGGGGSGRQSVAGEIVQQYLSSEPFYEFNHLDDQQLIGNPSTDSLSQSEYQSQQLSSGNKMDSIFQHDDRLFSLQNLAQRMNQIGNGSFFSEIEKEKTKWMNPSDWQIHRQKDDGFKFQINSTANGSVQTGRPRKKKLFETEFRMDFNDIRLDQALDKKLILSGMADLDQKARNRLIKRRKQSKRTMSTWTSEEISYYKQGIQPHRSLISIDHHYNPKNLFKTSYLDVKSIEESERQARERLQKLQEEEDYKGFNGDEYDIDEYTLLEEPLQPLLPLPSNRMEVLEEGDPKTLLRSKENGDDRNMFYNDDGFGGETSQVDRIQSSQIDDMTDMNRFGAVSSSQGGGMFSNGQDGPLKKRQNHRKMKIQELKSRLWDNLDTQLKQDDEELSYVELLQELQLEHPQSASIQSCLVAVLHLCNEKNLELFENQNDNFRIRFAKPQEIQDGKIAINYYDKQTFQKHIFKHVWIANK